MVTVDNPHLRQTRLVSIGILVSCVIFIEIYNDAEKTNVYVVMSNYELSFVLSNAMLLLRSDLALVNVSPFFFFEADIYFICLFRILA
jgi:hypothetical protein